MKKKKNASKIEHKKLQKFNTRQESDKKWDEINKADKIIIFSAVKQESFQQL